MVYLMTLSVAQSILHRIMGVVNESWSGNYTEVVLA
jgi:hypothetical protein